MTQPTLAEQIIAAHSGYERVKEGELVTAKVDRVYLQDGNSPTIRTLFAKYGFDQAFDPSRVGIFFDHSVIVPDKHIAARLREAEQLAAGLSIAVFRAGEGISHVVALEMGWYEPGSIVIGSDSHTCTGGATQCLSLGMGASDCAAAIVTGETWLRVPGTIWINVKGRPSPAARARDVALYALSKNGQQPFLYKSLEWTGEWLDDLTLDSCASIANLAVEMGAKCAFLPPGKGRPVGMKPICMPDVEDPRVINLDINDLPPMISKPNSPMNTVPLDQCKGLQFNYVFIGTCTNGRLEDIAEAAAVLGEAKVHPNVQCLVTPGSRKVYIEAMERGYIEKLMLAGAIISPPGCSACLGTQGSIPASGDRVLSTMNRNFLGRMGNAEAEIYLASPLVAAHTAIRGELPLLEELSI